MKLYTTIQAQKLQDGKLITVKKAQGSNTELHINIMNETKGLLAYVHVLYRENELPMVYFVPVRHHAYEVRSDAERSIIVEREKGKKQKDEMCTDGKPHRYNYQGDCTGEDCYKSIQL